MAYIIHIDGGSRVRHGGGPGSGAAWAAVVQPPNDAKIELTGFVEDASNNEMEYEALIQALQWLVNKKIQGNIVIFSDSQLVVNQILGLWMIRQESLMPFWANALALIEELKDQAASVQLSHIRREENPEADALCNKTMDENTSRKENNETSSLQTR
jgi:ribonuclease HI